MAIQFSQSDFDQLIGILSQHGDWQNVRGRIDFMSDVFAGSPRKADILASLDLDGPPYGTAVRVIHRLSAFGQDKPGREILGVLINKLFVSLGGGYDADFLRSLLIRYPFTTLPVATHQIEGWRGHETDQSIAEKIIGENTLRHIYVLEQWLNLSHSVVRISNSAGVGTGFLVAHDLIITNNHVIHDKEIARESDFTFNYQLDRFEKEQPTHTVHTLPNGLFHTSPMAQYNATSSELDYSIVQLQDVPEQILPLVLKPTAPVRDSRVTIIQHPGGSYKKISLQNNFVEYVDEFVVQYTTSTEPGSSGSPVLNDKFEVVAIHHAGGDLAEPATKRHYLRNEAVRMSVILQDLKSQAPEIYHRIKDK